MLYDLVSANLIYYCEFVYTTKTASYETVFEYNCVYYFIRIMIQLIYHQQNLEQ